MKNTILHTFVISMVFLWVGSSIGLTAPVTQLAASKARSVRAKAVSIDNASPPGRIREVTAYNVGVRRQTSRKPCIGASGQNICRLVELGYKVCAANFVDPETVLDIEGYGMCVVLDRMNRRFGHRVDIAMREDEVVRAAEFGVQRRLVEVKAAPP